MYMKETIQELIRKGPGASKEYGGRYMVHWSTNAGDHMGRPTLSLSSDDGRITYRETEMWAKTLKGLWKKPCKILSEINLPAQVTYRDGTDRQWYVSRLVVYERESEANGTTQL